MPLAGGVGLEEGPGKQVSQPSIFRCRGRFGTPPPAASDDSATRRSAVQLCATLAGIATEDLEKLEASKRRFNKAKSDLGRRAARLANVRHKRGTRWKILVGAVVLGRAAKDRAAAKRLDRMLDEALTEDRDRALLEQWRSSRQ